MQFVQTASAFFEAEPSYKQQMFGFHASKTKWDFAGLVLDYDAETQMVTMEQRNYFKPGDTKLNFSVQILKHSK